MNRLPIQERSRILQLLCEGMAIRAIVRISGKSKNTIVRLLADAGAACQAYHDEHVRNLNSNRIQCDEIWSFCCAKAKNVATAKNPPTDAGGIWTWTAIDSDSKLAVSWLVGNRDAGYAHELMQDIARRLANRVQITTDGLKVYLDVVEGGFGRDVDYAQLVKLYGASPDGERRYSPAECIRTRQVTLQGKPDAKHISTSYVKRQNLTTRMSMRRFTRLTDAFSEKAESHAHAVALHFMHYNFVRIHSSLRVTPAMASGVTDHLWEMSDIVALLEARETAQDRRRGSYKKRNPQISN